MLAGKRVLLTGASGGIGSALAGAFIDAGANLVLVGRDSSALQRVASRVAPSSDRIHVITCDLMSASDRARLCETASTWQGGIELLVNNAGVAAFAPLIEHTPDEIDRAMMINLTAPIDLCRRLLPHLRSRPEAHIVNIGSVFGSIGFACNSVYSASKFGLRGFSEALRRELAGTGVRVHYFAPRATRTALNSAAVDALNAELGNAMDDPADVAAALLQALQKGRLEYVIGWPEKFFARVNALLPRLVDRALAKQSSAIQRHAHRPAVSGSGDLSVDRRKVG